MAEITQLAEFPLTGARQQLRQEAAVCVGGMLRDRLFVMWRPDENDIPTRVSRSQISDIARFTAEVDSAIDTMTLSHAQHSWSLMFNIASSDQPDFYLTEFGDRVPVIECGDKAAKLVQEALGRDDIRLAQKTLAWQRGEIYNPKTVAVAPLHIITLQSFAYAMHLAQQRGAQDKGATVDRVRANIVIDAPELEAMAELRRDFYIPSIDLGLDWAGRDTERCNVPGQDAESGVQQADLPRGFKDLPVSPRNATKRLLGTYAYAALPLGELRTLRVGQQVDIG